MTRRSGHASWILILLTALIAASVVVTLRVRGYNSRSAALALSTASQRRGSLSELQASDPRRSESAGEETDRVPEDKQHGSLSDGGEIAPEAGTVSASSGAGSTQSQNKLEVEILRILPTDFDPAEITRPPGPFFLAISNMNVLGEANLSLKRVNGAQLGTVQLPRGKTRWRQILDLPTGQYQLTDANHPDAVCLITITDK